MTFTDYVFNKGGYLLPASPDGKPLFKDEPRNRITDREHLLYYWKRNVKRYIFRPYSAGLLAIDIDVKNGKDGWSALKKIYKYDTDKKYYTLSPSGGLHIYFTVDKTDYVSCEILPNVEVKSRAWLTIPGSVSNKGDYIPVNSPESISGLPAEIAKLIPVRTDTPAPIYTPRTVDNISLNKIYEVMCKQGHTPQNGRNNFAFNLAKFSRKMGHNPDEVQNFLSFLISSDFSQREIQACVNSAFRGCNK